ncbi:uncharacterized protein LOC141615216 [Silene latifolia]|uniref:uncharacterized protein LOC141615216 n=1 Tax=Silene latifolia TaxID=37657 RepID=UPI003D7899AD
MVMAKMVRDARHATAMESSRLVVLVAGGAGLNSGLSARFVLNRGIGTYSRRDFLVFTATTSLTAITLPFIANAKNIPLFGLRKKLEKAEEIIEEGIESAEKGLETTITLPFIAEKEIEEAAEGGGIVGGLTQAGIVAAAEMFGIVVATSIVNGILGPEPKRS